MSENPDPYGVEPATVPVAPNPREIVRVVRVLEFIGPRSWIEGLLTQAWLAPGRVPILGPGLTARELLRTDLLPTGEVLPSRSDEA